MVLLLIAGLVTSILADQYYTAHAAAQTEAQPVPGAETASEDREAVLSVPKYADIHSSLTEIEQEGAYEPAPDVLNLAYFYPEDADESDVIHSYAGRVYRDLMTRDAQYIADIYDMGDVTPLEMTKRLGLGAERVLGKYNPNDSAQRADNPSSWIIKQFKNVNISFYDADGNRINEYSNVKDIMSMANVYGYYHDHLDAEAFETYCNTLYEKSHSYRVSMGEVYYCNGCLNKTILEEAQEAIAEEERQNRLSEALEGAETGAADIAAELPTLSQTNAQTTGTTAFLDFMDEGAEASLANSTDGNVLLPQPENSSTENKAGAGGTSTAVAATQSQEMTGAVAGTTSGGPGVATETAAAQSEAVTQAQTSATTQAATQTAAPETSAQPTSAAATAATTQPATTVPATTAPPVTSGFYDFEAQALEAAVPSAFDEENLAEEGLVFRFSGQILDFSEDELNSNAVTQAPVQTEAATASPQTTAAQTQTTTAVPQTTAAQTQAALPSVAVEKQNTQPETAQTESAATSTAQPETTQPIGPGVSTQAAETLPQETQSDSKKTQRTVSICPGHVDLYVTVTLLGLDDSNGLISVDSIGNEKDGDSGSWQGWTAKTRKEALDLRNQDWFKRYGLTISVINVRNPLTQEEISAYLSRLPETTSEARRKVIQFALNSVGKVPYYWGGKPYKPGYEGNNFGSVIATPDHKGRVLRGLDCSGWINWVYWSALGSRLAGESTGTLVGCGTRIQRSELQPGDIIIRTGADAHVVMFLEWSTNGNFIGIHETAGSVNNVTVAEMSANWPYYRKLID